MTASLSLRSQRVRRATIRDLKRHRICWDGLQSKILLRTHSHLKLWWRAWTTIFQGSWLPKIASFKSRKHSSYQVRKSNFRKSESSKMLTCRIISSIWTHKIWCWCRSSKVCLCSRTNNKPCNSRINWIRVHFLRQILRRTTSLVSISNFHSKTPLSSYLCMTLLKVIRSLAVMKMFKTTRITQMRTKFRTNPTETTNRSVLLSQT